MVVFARGLLNFDQMAPKRQLTLQTGNEKGQKQLIVVAAAKPQPCEKSGLQPQQAVETKNGKESQQLQPQSVPATEPKPKEDQHKTQPAQEPPHTAATDGQQLEATQKPPEIPAETNCEKFEEQKQPKTPPLQMPQEPKTPPPEMPQDSVEVEASEAPKLESQQVPAKELEAQEPPEKEIATSSGQPHPVADATEKNTTAVNGLNPAPDQEPNEQSTAPAATGQPTVTALKSPEKKTTPVAAAMDHQPELRSTAGEQGTKVTPERAAATSKATSSPPALNLLAEMDAESEKEGLEKTAVEMKAEPSQGQACASQSQAPSGKVATVAAQPSSALKCACCGEEDRAAKSIYGPDCKKALNNIDKKEAKDSNRTGARWQKWCEAKRQGGAALNALIMGYRHECKESAGSGNKRGTFDFMKCMEEIRKETAVEEGTKLRYMSLTKWLNHAQEEFEMTVVEAQNKWDSTNRTTAAHKKKYRGKTLCLPMPFEDFILGSAKASHCKIVRKEGKQIKNAANQQLDEAEENMSTDLATFNAQQFSQVGGDLFAGMDAPSLSRRRSEQASSPAAPSPDENKEAPAPSTVPATEQKEEIKKRKRFDLAAAKNKSFDKLRSDLDNHCRGLLVAVEGEEKKARDMLTDQDVLNYQAYIDTMDRRASLVKLCLETGQYSSAHLAAEIQRVEGLGECVPTEKDEQLLTLEASMKEIEEAMLAAQDEDSLKIAQQQLKERVALYKRLTSAANRAISDLKKAVESRKRRKVANEEKEKKQAEKKKKLDEKAMEKLIKDERKFGGSELPFLWASANVIGSIQNNLPTFETLSALLGNFKGDATAVGTPFLVKSAAEEMKPLLENQAVNGFVQVFEAQFPLSKQAKEKGRAQTGLLGFCFFFKWFCCWTLNRCLLSLLAVGQWVFNF